MAIDPKLVSIKKAGDLPSGIPTASGEFLYFEDETLKKAEMSDLYDRLESAYLGIITPSSTIPSTGSWYGTVLEAGTFSNVTPAITVDTADFDVENGTANNEVRIIISDGVATKDVRRVKGEKGDANPVFNPNNNTEAPTMKGVADYVGAPFPYKVAEDKGIAIEMAKSVLDLVIINRNPAKFYSFTNIDKLSNGDIYVRVHEADTATGTGALPILNLTILAADSGGVKLYTSNSGGVTIKILLDVTYLKSLPVGKIGGGNYYADKYPLRENVFNGGLGIISSSENKASIETINSKIKPTFPYSSFPADSISEVETIRKVVKDLIILNSKVDKFYSLTVLDVQAGGDKIVRVHEANTATGTGAVPIINKVFTSQDSSVQLIEGELNGTTVKALIDVDYLLTLPVGRIGNFWSSTHPLNPDILKGLGNGTIRQSPEQLKILKDISYIYKSYSSQKLATVMAKAVKGIEIYNALPDKYYSLTNIVILDAQTWVIRVHAGSNDSGAGATAILQAYVYSSDSGFKFFESTHAFGRVRLLVDTDFVKTITTGTGNLWPNNYPLADRVFTDFNIDKLIDIQFPQTVQLNPKELPYIDLGDGCVTKMFSPVTRAGNPFLQIKPTEDYARANSHGDFYIKESGFIDAELFIYQDKNKPTDPDSINNYMTNVSFPRLPNTESMTERWKSYKDREDPAIDLIHPEIVDTGDTAVGGYRYWICASNHPAYVGLIEDEVFFVSNDFVEWKRIRAFNEAYNADIHAVDLKLPPHDLVPEGTVTYDMFMPVPQPSSGSFDVNGTQQTIKTYLKHDPVMVFDKDDGGIYALLVYNMKFDGDETPNLHNTSNQFLVCYRTFDGINWEVVRSDGTTLPLTQASDSRLIFTQTGGKNNYLRHRDHMFQRLGNSAVHHSDGFWYWFYGYNGDTIYRGTKFYNVDLANPVNVNTANRAVTNHPGHFSYGGDIYRWDSNGISKLNTTTYTWELLPINSAFRGFRGAEWQYKKSMHVASSGIAVWAVADRREFYTNLAAGSSFNLSWTTPITIGKVNVGQMIDAAQTSKRGYYFSIEIQHQTIDRIILYRTPYLIHNSSTYEFQVKKILSGIKVQKGDRLLFDVTVITYEDPSIAISDIVVKYLAQ